jgi:hypothetical protein
MDDFREAKKRSRRKKKEWKFIVGGRVLNTNKKGSICKFYTSNLWISDVTKTTYRMLRD